MNRAILSIAMMLGMTIWGAMPTCMAGDQDEIQDDIGNRVEARQLIEKWGNTIRDASTIEVGVVVRTKIGVGGQVLVPHGHVSTYALSFQRPDRVAMVLEQGTHGLTLVCDGEWLHRYWTDAGQYERRELDAMLEEQCADAEHGLVILPALVSRDPGSVIAGNFRSISDLGDEILDGITARHLKCENSDFAIELWFTGGEYPALAKAFLDLSSALDGAGYGKAERLVVGVNSMGTEFTFSGWRLGGELPAERFVFDPPFRVTEDVDERASGSTHPLIDQAAPLFTVKQLDGETFDLAGHLGRGRVVLLDFFATWCRPCRAGLSVIDGMNGSLVAEGLVVCAVNLRENRETVHRFVSKQRLDLEVALDGDGKIGELYRVKAIPQIVIIGRDGRVRSVRVGCPASLERDLVKELRELLDEDGGI